MYIDRKAKQVTLTYDEFKSLRSMRKHQTLYFRNRDRADLRAAKLREREIDRMIAEFDNATEDVKPLEHDQRIMNFRETNHDRGT